MSSQYLTLYKMIVLYMLKKSKDRLSKAQIYDFMLEKEYTNFLTLQEVFAELADSELVTENSEGNRTYLMLTDAGDETLSFFGNRINPAIREQIDEFFEEKGMEMRDDSAINAWYKKTGENEYTVSLSAREAGKSIMDISIPLFTESQAQAVCENWRNKSAGIYKNLMNELL